MTQAKLTCPHAKYDARMHIRCDKIGDMCAHQRWCMSKGWCTLTVQADKCPARRVEKSSE
jgi:hypothetical protein